MFEVELPFVRLVDVALRAVGGSKGGRGPEMTDGVDNISRVFYGSLNIVFDRKASTLKLIRLNVRTEVKDGILKRGDLQ